MRASRRGTGRERGVGRHAAALPVAVEIRSLSRQSRGHDSPWFLIKVSICTTLGRTRRESCGVPLHDHYRTTREGV